jgi:crotonobetainyl-CoA:carnitine CoA-transferase CaiB-like acyl-CoA transferase
VRTLEDLVDDPHLDDVGLFCESDHPTEGRVREMRPSTRWSGADVSIRRHAPTIGEHSVEILREAGFAEPAIAALIASGATLDGSTARPNRASST